MRFKDARVNLAAALTDVQSSIVLAGVQILPKMSAQFIPPAIMVGFPESVEYGLTSQHGSRWEVVVIGIGAAGLFDEAAMDRIDEWISDEGDNSIQRILERDPSLGGICDDVNVKSSQGYAVVHIEGKGSFLGCDWTVEIIV